MKAVVLAAGIGSRLNEVTKFIPKTMIQVKERYIFEVIVDSVVQVGIKEIIFVVGYKSKMLIKTIMQTCGSKKIKIKFIINPRYRETNTMYSLWLARKHLHCPFLYLHGDLIFGSKMLEEYVSLSYPNSVLIDKNFPLERDDAMKVICHHNELKYMSKSIHPNEMDGTAIGIYKFDVEGAKKLFRIIDMLINNGIENSWVSEAINILVKAIKIKAEENKDHPWADVDVLTDLNMANEIYDRIENE